MCIVVYEIEVFHKGQIYNIGFVAADKIVGEQCS